MNSPNFADVAASFDAAQADPRASQWRADDQKVLGAMEEDQRRFRPPPRRFVEPPPHGYER